MVALAAWLKDGAVLPAEEAAGGVVPGEEARLQPAKTRASMATRIRR
jgi:hypothetical protein